MRHVWLAVFLFVASCGSDSDSVDDLDGKWAMTLTITSDSCGSLNGVSNGANNTVIVTAGTITIQSESEFYSGPISDDGAFQATGKIVDPVLMTITFDGKAKGNEMSGKLSGQYVVTGRTCTIAGTFVGQKS